MLTKQKFSISPSLAVKIVEHLSKTNPGLIKEAAEQVEKPHADFDYFFILERTLHNFCKKKNIEPESIIGKKIGNQGMWDRTIFMAVIFKLYSPEVFTGYYNLTDNLRKELAGMLECHQTWISQQVAGIVSYMHEKNYTEFREQVNGYVSLIKNEIKVKEAEAEDNPVSTLFN